MQSHGKNGGLDQYGAVPFKQQQFGTAGTEGVNRKPRDLFLQMAGYTRPQESLIHYGEQTSDKHTYNDSKDHKIM